MMYHNLQVYMYVEKKYAPCIWLSISRNNQNLTVACHTMLRLLSGNCDLAVYKNHTSSTKICKNCTLGVIEDLFHFIMICAKFEPYRQRMFRKILANVNECTLRKLNIISRVTCSFILMGIKHEI